MIKYFRGRIETDRLLRLISSKCSDRSEKKKSPKTFNAPFMPVPKHSNHPNHMLVGGPVDAYPTRSHTKNQQATPYLASYLASTPSGAPYPPKQTVNLATHFSHTALALSVSAAALSLSLASGAQAQQIIPEECISNPSPLAAGATLTCASTTPISRIVTNLDGLTINIGTDETPTNLRVIGGFAASITVDDTGSEGITFDSRQATLYSSGSGISVTNAGTGAVSVITADVTGYAARGILAQITNADSNSDITIDTSAGAVISGNYADRRAYGIEVSHAGSGTIRITLADVSGQTLLSSSAASGETQIVLAAGANLNTLAGRGPGNNGIVATSTGADAHISLNAAATEEAGIINATGSGITMRAAGGGNVIIANLVSVTSQNGDAINAFSAGGEITINNIGSVMAGLGRGIFADSDGGSISIRSVGTTGGVRSTNGTAIHADATGEISGTGGNIVIGGSGDDALGAITGGGDGHGIYALTGGSGSITIDASANGATGGNAEGNVGIRVVSGGTGTISVANTGVGGAIQIISSRAISGIENAISATHGGTGAISLTLRDASTSDGDAITLNSQGGDITVIGSSSIISSDRESGIIINSQGGNVSVQDVTINANRSGISVDARRGDGDANISGGNISIGTVTRLGNVTSRTIAHGIYAVADGSGSITIVGSDVTGGQSAVRANIYGTGGISIDVANTSSERSQGIYTRIRNNAATGNISITASGTSMGVVGGIYARNAGLGSVTIQAADTTGTASSNKAIEARIDNANNNEILRITATGMASGGNMGIFARHGGTGALTINTVAVSATTGDAILAEITNSVATGLLSVTATGAVIGGQNGINARNAGSGGITISSTHTVTGPAGHGIFANSGGGETSIYAAVGVTGSVDGINVQAGGADSSITIEASGGSVMGGRNGAFVRNAGSGTSSIRINSAAVTGMAQEGIFAQLSNSAATGEIAITATDAIMGVTSGISAQNEGTGRITIEVSGVSASAGNAISANSAGGEITISGAYTVTGTGGHGIFADSDGGDISIHGVGRIDGVTGSAGHGIHADATGGSGGNINIGGITAIGDVTGSGTGNNGINALTGGTDSTITIDSSSGMVTGAYRGINATNAGDGASSVSITTAAVTSAVNDGISAYLTNSAATGDLSITATGTVIGRKAGFDISSEGLGGVSITTAAVTGIGGSGIFAALRNANTTGDISITASGAIMGTTGLGLGIWVENHGRGGIIINSATVTSPNQDAIFARLRNSAATGEISITASGAISSGTLSAIDVRNAGTGGITIRGAHTVSGGTRGISADSDGGDVSIQGVGLTGGITSLAGHGIQVDASGGSGGNIIIGGSGENAIGAVTGTGNGNDGINALTDGADSSITIDASGSSVMGGSRGIQARNAGTGASSISITTSNSVTGSGSDGIFAWLSNSAATGDVNITATGTLIGASEGLDIYNDGTGGISITTAAVTGMNGVGIFARLTNSAATGVIEVTSTGAVMGGSSSIYARNEGAGSISISGAHTVHGTSGRGIFAGSDGGDISIQGVGLTGGITGLAGHGIQVDATGGSGGNIIIGGSGENAIGDVTAQDAENIGIYAQTDGVGSSITIDSSGGTVTGVFRGIEAVNRSTGGALSITTAAVTGAASTAIFAYASGPMMITATGPVMGGTVGIFAQNMGVGSISITASGAVMGNTNGIYAQNNGTGGISISSAHTVRGGRRGIYADSNGGGDVSIQGVGLTGGITGLAGHGIQVDARGGSGGNIIIGGSGENAIGAVTGTGTGNHGIYAQTDGVGSSITIDSSGGTVMGANRSIYALNAGTGASSISITTAAATGSGSDGIFARLSNSAATGEISITASGTVMGNNEGIDIYNDGTGGISITTAAVIGMDGVGIYANLRNSAATGGVSITASGEISSGTLSAIFVRNLGTGGITIRGAPTVRGGIRGIFADSDGGDISIQGVGLTGGVSGGAGHGIEVDGRGGSGSNIIIGGSGENAIGDVTAQGTENIGIFVQTSGTNSSITIDSSGGTVMGANRGIEAVNQSTGGALSITTAAVTGAASSAIFAYASGPMMITATGPVMGGTVGIFAQNMGVGSISITASGAVMGNTDGIYAQNYGSGGITISGIPTVSGGRRGIYADSNGGSDISIQGVGLTGGITGSAGHGIRADARGGSGGNIIIGGSGENAIGAVTGTGTGNHGIYAQTDGVGSSITIDSSGGTVMGASRSIYALNAGTGASSISITTAAVTGSGSDGIFARLSNSAATGEISITASGTVMGNFEGFDIYNDGTGGISITTAAVIGMDGVGIYANLRNSAATGGVSITASGEISSGTLSAIFVRNLGTGGITISGAPTVRGGIRGIFADSNGGDVSIQGVGLTGGVSGGAGHGIEVDGRGGSGSNINIGGITAIGAVTGTGTDSDGINALTDGIGSTITIITSGAVRGGQDGIDARNMGTGGISISGAHTVSGVRGIYADSDGAPVSIQGVGLTGGVTGSASHGIQVDARGANGRDVLIGDQVAIGNVSGSATASGISVLADGGASRVVINSVGTVTGGGGIIVGNVRAGETFITAAEVIGLAGNAIEAISSGGGRITISGAHTVRGTGGRGILARSAGARVSIQGVGLTGGVTGTASHGIEVDARGANGRDVLIGDQVAIGNVSGSATASGISVLADGGASRVVINSVGTVTGGTGIIVGNVRAGETFITAAEVIGLAGNAIEAISSGRGRITISGAHTVRGTGGRGILARSAGARVSIQGVGLTGGVTGTASHGIEVDARGANGRDILIGDQMAIGNVSGSASASGISALADGAQSRIIINSVGTVTGGTGIVIGNVRAGATSITAAQVIGLAGDAIQVISSGGGSISISGAHTITGTGGRGIVAITSGGVSIQGVGLTGGVTGTAGRGIYADTRGDNGRNIAIGDQVAIGDVTGSTRGIFAVADGAQSSITINSVGTVMGDIGISVGNVRAGATFITAAEVIGLAGDAIEAISSGGGRITISGTHIVRGSQRGIFVDSAGGDISILGVGLVGGVTGSAGHGIQVDATGGSGGNINIGGYGENAIGDVTGTGGGNSGINARTDGSGRSITIDTSDSSVMGSSTGISAQNEGTGTTSITVSSVSASAGIGIQTRTTAGASVTVNAGGTVSGTAGGTAIQTSAPLSDTTSRPADSVTIMGTVTGNISTGVGDDTVTLAEGSTTTGITIDLGAGADTLNLAAASFGALAGGAGADTLRIISTDITSDSLTAATITGIETLVFAVDDQFRITGSAVGLARNIIAAGTTLDLAAGSSLSGDLVNNSALEVAGSASGSATVTGSLTLSAGGTLSLDTAGIGNANDLLTVNGAVTLGGTLVLRQTATVDGTVILINGATGISGDFDTILNLRNGVLVSQTLIKDTVAFDLQLITRVESLNPTEQTHTGCTVMGGGILMAGGTLNCISETPLTDTIFTNVDGVTINVGNAETPTIVNVPDDGNPDTNDDAIRAIVGLEGTAGITIDTSSGTLTGANKGILAYSAGTGAISITAATVTGTTSDGIRAEITNVASIGLLSVAASGEVIGGDDGIFAHNIGTGGISISGAHTVRGSTRGIFADSDGGDISIQGVGLTGGVTGSAGHGIHADARGTTEGTGGSINIGGSTAIGAVTGTGTDNNGIFAQTHGTDSSITIDSSGGAVIGPSTGIFARNTGIGASSISITTSTVTGVDADGIDAQLSGVAVTGDLSITATGAVTGQYNGIYTRITNTSATGDMFITSTGAVTGGGIGISAINEGTGGISIMSAAASSIFFDSQGIDARLNNTSATGDISITTTGTVMGGTTAISAQNLGTGGISIMSADVTGRFFGSRGIYARLNNTSATGDISITASGTIMAGGFGIFAQNEGTGGITVDASTAGASGGTGAGISVVSSGTGAISVINAGSGGTDSRAISITSSGAVSGATEGIAATHSGDGAITIASSNSVTGQASDAIRANSAGGAISISGAHTVLGSARGIFADSDGGDISIQGVGLGVEGDDMTGGITGSAGHGIQVDARGATQGTGGNINIGGITAIGAVSGTGSDGINVQTDGAGSSITIDTSGGAVIGETYGIAVNHAGSGMTRITVADVTGPIALRSSAASGETEIVLVSGANLARNTENGIYATSTGAGAHISINAAATEAAGVINAAESGIIIRATGSGNVTIANLVSITGRSNDGIRASSVGGEIAINNIASVMGGLERGILANSDGGDITIQGVGLTGGVQSSGSHGIEANALATERTGGNIIIGGIGDNALGSVTSGSDGYGIFAETNGSGSITIDASMAGAIGGTGEENAGIRVRSDGTGAISVINAGSGGTGSRAISISSTGAVSGAVNGISVRHTGDGAITISSYESVAGQAGDAISANTAGGDISISGAHTVTGTGGIGISAVSGGGDISIQGVGATGGVSGTIGHGIFADVTGGTGGNIIIGGSGENAIGDVFGANRGINATNAGAGASSISITSGNITSAIFGIYAYINNTASTGDLEITATGAIVSNFSTGITATTTGTGSISITTSNSVTGNRLTGGTNSNSITARIRNSAATGDISITASGAVMSGLNGIFAQNDGSGGITISGAHTVLGTGGRGIYADSDGGDISIQGVGLTGGVTGSAGHGIRADARGLSGGNIIIGGAGSNINIGGITAIGDVTGTGDGINALTSGAGSTITITASGAVMGGGFGIDAQNRGTGGISISGAHTVRGGRHGIVAVSDGGDISILGVGLTGGITGSTGQGIRADAIGGTRGTSGNIIIIGGSGDDAIGDVTSGNGHTGIIARTDGTDSTITIDSSGGTVMGSGYGIYARSTGSGASGISITTAAVIGTANVGIDARLSDSAATGEISVTATGMVSGDTRGIDVQNTGTGGISITSGGNVTSNTTGIYVRLRNSTATSDISVTATGAIMSGSGGIFTRNSGTGGISITTAAVTGMGDDGIFAQLNNTASTGVVNITASGAVMSSSDGIDVRNLGTGGISISGAHTVRGGGRGIFADSDGGDISIQGVGLTGGITGSAGHGIRADARGRSGGNIIIGGSGDNAIGAVTGTGDYRYGINAQTDGADSTITIDASGGAVMATNRAINATNAGSRGEQHHYHHLQ